MIKNGTLKVFVYGTLKVGGRFAKRFDRVRRSSKPARVKGKLFSAGWFPAAAHGNGVIHGELHEYDDAEHVLKAFDGIEGFIGPGREGNLYDREIVTVKTDDGEEEASMYLYAKNVEGMKAVESGVWKI